MNRILAWSLVSLCGCGLLVSWTPTSIAWYTFQTAIFAITMVWSIGWVSSGRRFRFQDAVVPLLLIAIWGVVQAFLGISVYRFATQAEVLRWLTYAAVLMLAGQLLGGPERRTQFLRVFVFGSLALAVISVTQYFSSNGKILWYFVTDPVPKLGPFLSHDHYCSFVALGLGMALDQAICVPKRRTLFIVAAAIMYASAIAGSSRAGAFLLTLEVPTVILLSGRRHAVSFTKLSRVAALVGVACCIVVAVVGWQSLIGRFQLGMDPLRVKLDVAAITMWKSRPLTGFGQGTWAYVYPQFALAGFDGPRINAAHNDWLEFAGDGGVPLVVFVLAIFGLTVRNALRNPWAIGTVVPFLHALIDFPLHTQFIPAVLFLVIGVAAVRPQEVAVRLKKKRIRETQTPQTVELRARR